jgi:AcrR family transcriptional regulator
MGRPTTIEDQKILDAAREVFLEKGISATTEEVAQRAGISQGSIFKHFKSKQVLFLAAMKAARDREDWVKFLKERSQEVGLRQALTELGVTILAFLSQILPLVLQSWSNRGEFGLPEGMDSGRSGPAQAMGEIVEFLEGEMRAGRLRSQDPWFVMRAFSGSLQGYVLMKLILKHPLPRAWTPEEYVRGIVDTLWFGIGPEPGAPAKQNRAVKPPAKARDR